MDADNNNAQNANARAILRSWNAKGTRVRTLAYGTPDPSIVSNPLIDITRLWRRHAWMAHLSLCYLGRYDAIFYPGVHAADIAGLRWRRLGRSSPVIATLEGLVGNREREADYSRSAGHPVHCQEVPAKVLKDLDEVYLHASHVIAISPFLARMGATRYGDKFSVLPVGIDSNTFHPPASRDAAREPLVVSAGRVASHKRPQVFLQLASRFPQARFRWYGEGTDRSALIAEAGIRSLINLEFPGAKSPGELAEAFRKADAFVLPSLSEGVPKVIQEAAACGLPVVAFGCYEPPAVIDKESGFLVWSDQELFDRVAQLVEDGNLRQEFGARAATRALDWSWDRIGPLWQDHIMQQVQRKPG